MKTTLVLLATSLAVHLAYAENKPPAKPTGASASATAEAQAIAIAPVHIQVAAPAPTAPATLRAEQSISFERPVASAVAPGLVAVNGTCSGSASIGVQGPGFGVSGGRTFLDEGCDIRYDVLLLDARREHDAAFERGCDKSEIRAARKRAGTLCAADRESTPVAARDAIFFGN